MSVLFLVCLLSFTTLVSVSGNVTPSIVTASQVSPNWVAEYISTNVTSNSITFYYQITVAPSAPSLGHFTIQPHACNPAALTLADTIHWSYVSPDFDGVSGYQYVYGFAPDTTTTIGLSFVLSSNTPALSETATANYTFEGHYNACQTVAVGPTLGPDCSVNAEPLTWPSCPSHDFASQSNVACNSPSVTQPAPWIYSSLRNFTLSSSVNEAVQCPDEGLLMLTYSYSDSFYNYTCEVDISYIDNSQPTINFPSGYTQALVLQCSDLASVSGGVASLIPNTSSSTLPSSTYVTAQDNCDSTPSLTSCKEPPVSGLCINSNFYATTYTATDRCGKSTCLTQTISILDTKAPILTTPDADHLNWQCDMTNYLPSLLSPPSAVTDSSTVGDNGCGYACSGYNPSTPITPTNSTYPGNCGYTYELVRTWSLTDCCHNVATATQRISIIDTSAPLLFFDPSFTPLPLYNCTDEIPYPAVYWNDSCGYAGAQLLCAANDPSCPHLNETITNPSGLYVCPYNKNRLRTYTFCDDCGNTATPLTQMIVIRDTAPPQFTPASLNANPAVLPIDASVPFQCFDLYQYPFQNLSTEDPCSLNVNETSNQNIQNDTCTNERLITRIWNITDDCNNNNSYSSIISVTDVTPLYVINSTLPSFPSYQCSIDVPALSSGSSSIQYYDCVDTLVKFYSFSPSTANEACANCYGDFLNLTITQVPATLPTQIPLHCSYSVTRTYQFYDCSGNTQPSPPTVTFLVNDTLPPIFCSNGDCSSYFPSPSIPIQCQDAATYTWPQLPTTDNCVSAPVNVSPDCIQKIYYPSQPSSCSQPQTPPKCEFNYTYAAHYTALDQCGNVATASYSFPVVDTDAPCAVLSSESFTSSNPTFSGASESCNLVFPTVYYDCNDSFSDPSLITLDNCANTTETTVGPPKHTYANSTYPGCDNVYNLTRNWVVTDSCGNANTFTQLVVVQDYFNPELSCTGVFCGNYTGSNAVYCTDIPPIPQVCASDNCNGLQIVFNSSVVNSTTCDPTYQIFQTITRTWIATDQCGRSTTYVQIIQVKDNQAPDVTQVPNFNCPCPLTLQQCGLFNATYGYPPAATDDCTSFTWSNKSVLPTPNTTCPDQVYQFIWVVTDFCGNPSTVAFNITTYDNTPPVITPSGPASVECLIPPAQSLNASDICDSSFPRSFNSTDGPQQPPAVPCTCPYNYTVNRTWAPVDTCGNTQTYSQIFTIVNNVAPTWNPLAPGDFQCSDFVTVAYPTAVDNCDNTLSVSSPCPAQRPTYTDQPSVSIYDAGFPYCRNRYQFNRTWIVNDLCNPTISFNQLITVDDTSAPTISLEPTPCSSGTTCDTGAAQCYPPPRPTICASDNCRNLSVDYSEYNTTVPGHPCRYIQTRSAYANDSCSLSPVWSWNVTVDDYELPQFVWGSYTPPANNSVINVYCTHPGYTVPSSSANCSYTTSQVYDLSYTANPSSCDNQYLFVVLFLVNTSCGTQQTYTWTYNVTNPRSLSNITWVPADFSASNQNTTSAECFLPPPPVYTAYDACGNPVTASYTSSNGDTAPSAHCPFATTRTWTFTDTCGTSSVYTQYSSEIGPTQGLINFNFGSFSTNVNGVTLPVSPSSGTAATQYSFTVPSSVCSITPPSASGSDSCGNPATIPAPPQTFDACINTTLAYTYAASDSCSNAATATLTGSYTLTPVPSPNICTLLTGTCITPSNKTNYCPNNTPNPPYVVYQSSPCVQAQGPFVMTPGAATSWSSLPSCPLAAQFPFTYQTENTCNQPLPPQTYTITYGYTSSNQQSAASQNDTTGRITLTADATINGQPFNPATDSLYPCDQVPTITSPPAFADLCGNNITNVSSSQHNTTLGCKPAYIQYWQWVATDSCYSTYTYSLSYTITNTYTPEISTPAPSEITVQCGFVPSAPAICASNTCPGLNLTYSEQILPGAHCCDYTVLRTWNATDSCYNSASPSQSVNPNGFATTTQTIHVVQTIPPVFSNVPPSQTIGCTQYAEDYGTSYSYLPSYANMTVAEPPLAEGYCFSNIGSAQNVCITTPNANQISANAVTYTITSGTILLEYTSQLSLLLYQSNAYSDLPDSERSQMDGQGTVLVNLQGSDNTGATISLSLSGLTPYSAAPENALLQAASAISYLDSSVLCYNHLTDTPLPFGVDITSFRYYSTVVGTLTTSSGSFPVINVPGTYAQFGGGASFIDTNVGFFVNLTYVDASNVTRAFPLFFDVIGDGTTVHGAVPSTCTFNHTLFPQLVSCDGCSNITYTLNTSVTTNECNNHDYANGSSIAIASNSSYMSFTNTRTWCAWGENDLVYTCVNSTYTVTNNDIFTWSFGTSPSTASSPTSGTPIQSGNTITYDICQNIQYQTVTLSDSCESFTNLSTITGPVISVLGTPHQVTYNSHIYNCSLQEQLVYSAVDSCGAPTTASYTISQSEPSPSQPTFFNASIPAITSLTNPPDQQCAFLPYQTVYAEGLCSLVFSNQQLTPIAPGSPVVPSITPVNTSADNPYNCAYNKIDNYLYQIYDICGNTNTLTYTAKVKDTIAPQYSNVPNTPPQECNAASNPSLTPDIMQSDNCNLPPTFQGLQNPSLTNTVTYSNQTCTTLLYTQNFTYVVYDSCGNENSTTFTFVVQDTTPPFFDLSSLLPNNNCSASTPTQDCTSIVFANCTTDLAPINVLPLDSCAVQTLEVQGPIRTNLTGPDACPYRYNLTYLYRVKDCANLTSGWYSVVYVVTDDEIPVISAPPSDYYSQTSCVNPAVPSLCASDLCDGISLTFNGNTAQPNPSCANRTLSYNWTSYDACDNTAVPQYWTATIADVTPPTIASDSLRSYPTNLSCLDVVAHLGEKFSYNLISSQSLYNYIQANLHSNSSYYGFDVNAVDPGNCSAVEPGSWTFQLIPQCNSASPPVTPCPTSGTGSCPPLAELIFTYTVSDGCGNPSSVSYTFEIYDDQSPYFVNPQNASQTCLDSSAPYDSTFPFTVDVAHPCFSNFPTPSFTQGSYSPSSPPVNPPSPPAASSYITQCQQTPSFTFTTQDWCGNTNSQTYTVTYSYTGTLTWSAPPATSSLPCDQTYVQPDIPVTDGCGNVFNAAKESVGPEPNPVVCPGFRHITANWSASDCLGNVVSQTQVINLTDSVDPSLSVDNANVTDLNHTLCQSVPSPQSACATDNCVGVVLNFTQVKTPFYAGENPDCDQYEITYTYQAFDCARNSNFSTYTVTVNDTIPPVWNIPSPEVPGGPPSGPLQNCASVNITPPVVPFGVDYCESSILLNTTTVHNGSISSVSNPSGHSTCYGNYTVTYLYTVSDLCGNTNTWQKSWPVADLDAPTFSPPQPVINNSWPCDLNIAFVPIYIQDTCDPSLLTPNVVLATITNTVDPCSGAQGGTTCLNGCTAYRNYSAVDDCGNENSTYQIVTMVDVTPPPVTFFSPENVSIPAFSPYYDFSCNQTVELPYLVPGSDCSGVQFSSCANCTQQVVSGQVRWYPLVGPKVDDNPNPACGDNAYTQSLLWNVSDYCGNFLTYTSTIRVSANQVPVMDVSGVVPFLSGTCNNVPNPASVCCSNECDGVNLEIIQTRINGSCSYIYNLTRSWNCSDNCGNSADQTGAQQLVVITHTDAPTFIQDSNYWTTVQNPLIQEQCYDTFVPLILSANDSCHALLNVPSPTKTNLTTNPIGINHFTCYANWSYEILWNITDECGLSSYLSQNVSIFDNIPPTAVNQSSCLSALPSVNVVIDSISSLTPPTGYDLLTPPTTFFVGSDNCSQITYVPTGCILEVDNTEIAGSYNSWNNSTYCTYNSTTDDLTLIYPNIAGVTTYTFIVFAQVLDACNNYVYTNHTVVMTLASVSSSTPGTCSSPGICTDTCAPQTGLISCTNEVPTTSGILTSTGFSSSGGFATFSYNLASASIGMSVLLGVDFSQFTLVSAYPDNFYLGTPLNSPIGGISWTADTSNFNFNFTVYPYNPTSGESVIALVGTLASSSNTNTESAECSLIPSILGPVTRTSGNAVTTVTGTVQVSSFYENSSLTTGLSFSYGLAGVQVTLIAGPFFSYDVYTLTRSDGSFSFYAPVVSSSSFALFLSTTGGSLDTNVARTSATFFLTPTFSLYNTLPSQRFGSLVSTSVSSNVLNLAVMEPADQFPVYNLEPMAYLWFHFRGTAKPPVWWIGQLTQATSTLLFSEQNVIGLSLANLNRRLHYVSPCASSKLLSGSGTILAGLLDPTQQQTVTALLNFATGRVVFEPYDVLGQVYLDYVLTVYCASAPTAAQKSQANYLAQLLNNANDDFSSTANLSP